jgi:phage terminase large subunit GpA-like protein
MNNHKKAEAIKFICEHCKKPTHRKDAKYCTNCGCVLNRKE